MSHDQFGTALSSSLSLFLRNVDLFDCLADDAKPGAEYTTYDLIANVVHDGKPDSGQGTYRIQLLHRVRMLSYLSVVVRYLIIS